MWPEESHEAAHTLIDSVYALDVDLLSEWVKEYPRHSFGYEDFLRWALKASLAGRKVADRARKVLGRETLLDAPQLVGEITESFPLVARAIGHKARAEYRLIRFSNDDAAIRVTVRAEDRTVLSRVHVDPDDGSFRVIDHFPGRYQGLGLPQSLLNEALGVDGEPVESRRMTNGSPTGAAHLPSSNGQDRIVQVHERMGYRTSPPVGGVRALDGSSGPGA